MYGVTEGIFQTRTPHAGLEMLGGNALWVLTGTGTFLQGKSQAGGGAQEPHSTGSSPRSGAQEAWEDVSTQSLCLRLSEKQTNKHKQNSSTVFTQRQVADLPLCNPLYRNQSDNLRRWELFYFIFYFKFQGQSAGYAGLLHRYLFAMAVCCAHQPTTSVLSPARISYFS